MIRFSQEWTLIQVTASKEDEDLFRQMMEEQEAREETEELENIPEPPPFSPNDVVAWRIGGERGRLTGAVLADGWIWVCDAKTGSIHRFRPDRSITAPEDMQRIVEGRPARNMEHMSDDPGPIGTALRNIMNARYEAVGDTNDTAVPGVWTWTIPDASGLRQLVSATYRGDYVFFYHFGADIAGRHEVPSDPRRRTRTLTWLKRTVADAIASGDYTAVPPNDSMVRLLRREGANEVPVFGTADIEMVDTSQGRVGAVLQNDRVYFCGPGGEEPRGSFLHVEHSGFVPVEHTSLAPQVRARIEGEDYAVETDSPVIYAMRHAMEALAPPPAEAWRGSEYDYAWLRRRRQIFFLAKDRESGTIAASGQFEMQVPSPLTPREQVIHRHDTGESSELDLEHPYARLLGNVLHTLEANELGDGAGHTFAPGELVYADRITNGGTRFFIVPRDWFRQEGTLYDDYVICNVLRDYGFVQTHPSVFMYPESTPDARRILHELGIMTSQQLYDYISTFSMSDYT
jgi:hypothetical protein